MTMIRILHPGGPWVDFDTDEGTVLAASGEMAEAVDGFTGEKWRPAAEAPMLTLDHSTGVLCLRAVERAAMFHAEMPPTGWGIFEVHDDGTTTAHTPSEADLVPVGDLHSE